MGYLDEPKTRVPMKEWVTQDKHVRVLESSICLRIFVYFPLLVFKGVYHYWKYTYIYIYIYLFQGA